MFIPSCSVVVQLSTCYSVRVQTDTDTDTHTLVSR